MAAFFWGWIKRHALAIVVLGLLLLLDFLIAFSTNCLPVLQAKCAQYGITQTFIYRSLSWSEDWVGRHEHFIVAGATVAIALFTLTLWRSTDKLWAAGERQIASAAASAERMLTEHERAWLKIDAEIAGPLFMDRIEMRVDFQIRNVGNSPAVRVGFIGRMAPSLDDAEVLAEKLFEEIGASNSITSGNLSNVLFPGDELRIENTVDMDVAAFQASLDELDELEAPPRKLYPAVAAMVVYNLTGQSRPRFTIRCFEIKMIDNEFGFDGTEGTINESDIYFSGELFPGSHAT